MLHGLFRKSLITLNAKFVESTISNTVISIQNSIRIYLYKQSNKYT